jgi:hypothetical protein
VQVQQRDNEIALLINMLKGRGTAAGPAGSSSSGTSSSGSRSISSTTSRDVDKLSAPDVEVKGQPDTAAGAGPQPVVLSALLDASLLSDRHKAFEVFRQSYRQGQVRHSEDQQLAALPGRTQFACSEFLHQPAPLSCSLSHGNVQCTTQIAQLLQKAVCVHVDM